MATSRAGAEPPRPQEKPHTERPVRSEPPTPPLEGARSLREALAQITGKNPPAGAAPAAHAPRHAAATTVHAPDLKETLRTVAPKAEAKPAELPEEVLRSMLAVDEEDIESPFERPDK
jgi:hypothetical protein